MSWILGFNGPSLPPDLRAAMAGLHPSPRFVSGGGGHYVAAGGLPETCLHGTLPSRDPAGVWFVLGLGLQRTSDGCYPMDGSDWQSLLAAPTPDVAHLNGHFIALRLEDGNVECFTDPLGLRVFYLTRSEHGALFSTRADWLARLLGGLELDLSEFGSQWLAFNQLSTRSMIRGLQRLGPGGRATCTGSDVHVVETPWTPASSPISPDTFTETIRGLAHPRLPQGRTLSLGLSGGIDSRVLLALHTDDAALSTHVFGDPAHPDVHIAQRIAAGARVPQVHFHGPVPDADTCVAMLHPFAAQTHATFPASAVLGLRYYPSLHKQNKFMIDGGFGEIGRRQFFNRLRHRGGSALRSGGAAALLPFFLFRRADVFSPEADDVMRQGTLQQIAALWDRMPHVEEVGMDNFLDLLAVRTRLPAYAFEQSRLDGLIPCFMPMAQPAFLDAVFGLSPFLRRGGRLYRRIIRDLNPSLPKYPLVKGATTYPFSLPPLAAFAWTKVTARVSPGYSDVTRSTFLSTLKPFVLDLLHTDAARTCAPYDYPKLVRLVEDYYRGERTHAAAVDWWLSFELWRQSVAADGF